MTNLSLLGLAVLALAVWRGLYKLKHPLVRCRCGVILGRFPKVIGGAMCVPCQYRAEQEQRDALAMETARREADRRYAAAESARIDGRFPVRRAGTFGLVGGTFVLDGWVFEDPRAITDTAAPAATVPQQLTLGRWSTVYGWTLAELHSEAHGSFCTCLKP